MEDMGDIVINALLNTVLGMGTVFAVLIFISFIIALLVFVPKLQNYFAEKKNDKARQSVPSRKVEVKAAPKKSAVNHSDDSELVAVISAAIAAVMSQEAGQAVSADGLVVRSIKRRK